MNRLRLLLLLAVLLAGGAAQAASVAITNAGFEVPALLDGGTTAPTGWTTSGNAFAFRPTAATLPSGPPEGSQVLMLQAGGSASQTVGAVLTADTVYTLRVAVGSRADSNFIAGFEVRLEAGGTVLASVTETNVGLPGNGTFFGNDVVGLYYPTPAGHPSLGQPLTIRLLHKGAGASTTLMDGVVLSASSGVPPFCPPPIERTFSRPLDVWYGTVTIRSASDTVLATPSFAHLDRGITTGHKVRIEIDAAADPRVKNDLDRWHIPGMNGIEWVLDPTPSTDARQGLLGDYGTAGSAYGPGTLTPGTAVDGPQREYNLGQVITFEDDGSGGTCAKVNNFVANLTYHRLNATYRLSAANRCPRTHGYWKNHVSAWPASSLVLGFLSYPQSELHAILSSSSSRDASLILARQLIAAKLNLLSGSAGSPIGDAIIQADALLGTSRVPANVAPNSSAGRAMTAAATTLDDYNNRLLTPGCTP